MKLRLSVMAVALLMPTFAITAFSGGIAVAQEPAKGSIEIIVSHEGFNNNPNFRVEVEQGQEVEITFIYGDEDLNQNNPHVMFISGYNIQSDILDSQNPRTTVKFLASRPGEFRLTCILYCQGHDELQGGRIVVLPTGAAGPPTEEPGILSLSAPTRAQSGESLFLTATLKDSEEKPITGAIVKFFIRADFFGSGLMEVGEALTDNRGVAILNYTPKLSGEVQLVAHYGDAETTSGLTLAEASEPGYQTRAGIQLPAPGKEVVIGPRSAIESEGPDAPLTSFRLPGAVLSWLLLVVAAVALIWVTYFRVLYQVFRISLFTEKRGPNTRLLALVGMGGVVLLGTLLVLLLVTGPNSNQHLLH